MVFPFLLPIVGFLANIGKRVYKDKSEGLAKRLINKTIKRKVLTKKLTPKEFQEILKEELISSEEFKEDEVAQLLTEIQSTVSKDLKKIEQDQKALENYMRMNTSELMSFVDESLKSELENFRYNISKEILYLTKEQTQEIFEEMGKQMDRMEDVIKTEAEKTRRMVEETHIETRKVITDVFISEIEEVKGKIDLLLEQGGYTANQKIMAPMTEDHAPKVSKEEQECMDSLLEEEEKKETLTKEDLERFLTKGNYYYDTQNFKKAEEKFEKALRIDPENITALINLGATLEALGKLNKAIDYYEKGKKIAEDKNDKKSMAVALNNIGRILIAQCKYKRALEHFKRALSIFEDLKDNEEIVATLNYMGDSFKEQADTNQRWEAPKYYNAALNRARKVKNNKGIAISLNNMGDISKLKCDYEEALKYYNDALKIFEDLKDKKNEATTLNKMGYIFELKHHYEKALEHYKKALKIREELKRPDKKGIIKCLNKMGHIFELQKDHGRALEHYKKALNIAEELGDKKKKAICHTHIGDIIFSFQKDYERALEHYEEALNIREDLKDKIGIAICLNKIGDIFRHKDDYEKALDCYQGALKIAEDLRDKRGIAICLENIGFIFKLQGDYKKALKQFESSMEIFDKLENEKGITLRFAYCCENMAGCYEKLGDQEWANEYYWKAAELYGIVGLYDNSKWCRAQIKG